MDVMVLLLEAIADGVRDALLVWLCIVLAAGIAAGLCTLIMLRRWERNGRP